MPPAQPSRLTLILILGALATVSPFAIDMYLPAFPQVAESLGVTVAKVSLSLSSYFMGMSLGQLFYGPLLDRFGRKRPLYFGLGLFVLASVGCMLSHNVETLIALRFLQALGGCAAGVASLAMVRDFFPVEESAKVLSLLMLVISVSPMLAPTVGSAVALHLGWKWVFAILSLIVLLVLAAVWCVLPEGHVPDASISLKPKPILQNFWAVLKVPQFYTYAFAGALSFAGLLVYVAGSPGIFMQEFGVSTAGYGAIFAFLATGFIASNQVNIWLMKRFSSERIFQAALMLQGIISTVFVVGAMQGGFGLYATIAVFFCYLSCMGLAYPNAAALALAPFSKHAGSASALLGFLQIGCASLTSAVVGILEASGSLTVAGILLASAIAASIMFYVGRRTIQEEVHTSPVHAA